MKNCKLIFGVHYSLPPASSAMEKEKYYLENIKPLLTALYNNPNVKITLYFPGLLLEYLHNRHPESIMVISELSKKHQIEVLGGSYYEPSLALLTSQDRLGQIELLTTYIRRNVGRRPRGFWFHDQIWDSFMPTALNGAGMEYSFLNDTHFFKTGIAQQDINSPYISEEHGKSLLLFPINTELTNHFLNDQYQDIENYIEKLDNPFHMQEDLILTVFISGETIGKKLVNGDESYCFPIPLLDKLQENMDMKLYTASRVLKVNGRTYPQIYLPGTTYEDFCQTILSQIPQGEGIRHYRYFLLKYKEAHSLYTKMTYVNLMMNRIRGDKYRRKAARENLWEGQSCYGILHTADGGLYNLNNRHYCYSSLLEAEKLSRERGGFRAGINVVDYDMDGRNEYLYQGSNINSYVHRVGGSIIELDYLPDTVNYTNTFTRYPEYYHTDKEINEGYDQYSRNCFLDHVYLQGEEPETLDEIHNSDYSELYKNEYSLVKISKENCWLLMKTHFSVSAALNESGDIILEKKYIFRRSSIEVYYTFKNRENVEKKFTFSPEMNFCFPHYLQNMMELRVGGEESALNEESSESLYNSNEHSNINYLDTVTDAEIDIHFSEAVKSRIFKLKSQYFSHGEIISSYQGHLTLPFFNITLPALGEHKISTIVGIQKHKSKA